MSMHTLMHIALYAALILAGMVVVAAIMADVREDRIAQAYRDLERLADESEN